MPAPKDPKNYKEGLKAHLVKVPAYPQKLLAGSPVYNPAKDKASLAVKFKDPNFKLDDNKDYKDVCGLTHTDEVRNWVGGGFLTSCNSFIGQCCIAMGIPNLGQFELEALLTSLGKHHAWVDASSGERPGHGDIFTTAGHLHMGVSLGFEGDTWLTVEGGQGGPNSTGVDAVRFKRQPFNPAGIRGWCDIRVLIDPRAGVPDWLPGWWYIYAGDKTYHYHFNRYFELSYMPFQPANTSGAPPVVTDTGTYSVDGDNVVVTWRGEGGTERFKYDRMESFPGLLDRMSGASNGNEPLKGAKMGR